MDDAGLEAELLPVHPTANQDNGDDMTHQESGGDEHMAASAGGIHPIPGAVSWKTEVDACNLRWKRQRTSVDEDLRRRSNHTVYSVRQLYNKGAMTESSEKKLPDR